MYKGNRSRFFPVVVVIVIIAIVVFGLVSLVRFMFNSGKSANEPQTNALSSKLLDTSDGQSVSMIVRGPIVGDNDFRSFQVTISPSGRSITAWQGYDKTNVIATKSYDNNTAAYTQFVNALDYAGYSKTNNVKNNDTKGLCADGKVYDFQIGSGSNVTDDRWTTNCGVKGSFAGNGPAVRQLFLDQLPDARSITDQVDL